MRKLILILFLPYLIFSYKDEEELKNYIKYLSSPELEGRMTGSEGAKKARDFIKNLLRDEGFDLIEQPFPFISGNLLGEKNYFKLKIKDKDIEFKINEDFVPLPFSSSKKVKGELVFAGFGISAEELNYDDYSGVDVEGKIVLCMRFNPSFKDLESKFVYYDRISDKIITAREKGAKGFVIFTGETYEKEEKLQPFRKESMGADLGIPVVQISQKKAKEILNLSGYNLKELEEKIIKEKKPNSFILNNLFADFEVDLVQEKKECKNIISILKPNKKDFNGKYILLGAHYDHIGMGGETSREEEKWGKIHPGADDNGSGTALLLQLAKMLKKEKDKFNYGLIFSFFSGEELGIIGSSYFIKNPLVPLNEIVLMLNFDMVGRMRDDKLILLGVDTSPQIEIAIEEVSKNYEFKLVKDFGGFSQGDNTAFYKENIPILGFFTDIHPDYHKSTDTYEKINYKGMSSILKFASDLVLKFQGFEKIEFTPSKAVPKDGGKSAMRVYVGTIPAFGEEVEGYKISGVQPESPAERGGLKKDDIIIKINEKEIKNIYDYMSAFKGKKVGEEVEIEFIRNGEILKTKITLSPQKDKNR